MVVGIAKRCCDRTVFFWFQRFFGVSDFLAKAVFNCNTKTPLYKGWGGVEHFYTGGVYGYYI